MAEMSERNQIAEIIYQVRIDPRYTNARPGPLHTPDLVTADRILALRAPVDPPAPVAHVVNDAWGRPHIKQTGAPIKNGMLLYAVDPPERVSDWKTEPIGPAVQEFRRREEATQSKAAAEALERVSEASALRAAVDEAERQLRARLSNEKWLRMGLTDGAACSQRTVDAVLGPIRRALEDTKGEE